MIFHFWQQISDFGTSKVNSETAAIQLRVLNQVLANGTIWLIFFLFYNFVADNFSGNLLGALGLMLIAVSYFLIYNGKSRHAQHFLLLSLGLALTVAVYASGKASYCITLYIPTLSLVYLLFRDNTSVYFYYPYYFCSIVLSIVLTIYSPAPKYLANPELFSYAVLMMAFFMQIVILSAFKKELEKKERLIIKKQESLKSYSFLMNATLNSSVDGIFITGEKNQLVYTNQRFLEMWDISEAQIKDQSSKKIFEQLFDKLVTPKVFADQIQSLDSTSAKDVFKEIELLDGRFFEVHAQILKQDHQQILGCTYAFRDITEKKQTEKKLIESEQLFRSLFEEIPIGIALGTHLNGTLNKCNTQFQKMLGYTKEELEQKTVDDISHPEERSIHKETYHRVWHGELELFEVEKQYVKKDNSIVWGHTTVAVARDEQGKVKYDIAMIQDISQKKMAEHKIKTLLQELKQKNEELEGKVKARTQSLEDSNEELRRSNHDLEQFAYIASHDLQEPLRTVGNFVQLLEKQFQKDITAEGKEYIGFIVDGVARMSKLIQNLLKYSRVGRKDIEFTRVDLNRIIWQKMQDLVYRIKDSKAEVFIHELPQNISCEPNQLAIVFYNLLSNALKFNASKNATVELKHQERTHDWLFSVKDNGIGIEAQYQEKVFEIFKRLNGRDEFEGTGIGLALCKRIINRHNGKIWFESSPNQGTTFHFTISKQLITQSRNN